MRYMDVGEKVEQRSWWRRHRMHIIVFVVAIVAIVLVSVFAGRLGDFKNYGILGVFITAFVGSTAPFWPMPGSLAAFIAGGSFGWASVPFIALAAGTGEAIGECVYYSIGYGSQPALQKSKWYNRLQGWMERRGGLTIFVFSTVPNPLIRFVDVSAAGLHYPLRKFFPICWSGKVIKSFAFTLAGAGVIPWLGHLL
jgi:uncharacterized membrane protein YdjX (TVP38/TMEM64 family)